MKLKKKSSNPTYIEKVDHLSILAHFPAWQQLARAEYWLPSLDKMQVVLFATIPITPCCFPDYKAEFYCHAYTIVLNSRIILFSVHVSIKSVSALSL